MIPPFLPWTPLVLVLAAVTITGIVLYGRRGDPDRPRRHRDVPGLPDDGDLEPWEDAEILRMEVFYRKTAHDPVTRKNAARRRP